MEKKKWKAGIGKLWNEPDIAYWKGTLQEYLKLYDYTADAVKRALPTAKIGGPEVTGGGSKLLKLFASLFIRYQLCNRKNRQPARTNNFSCKGKSKAGEWNSCNEFEKSNE